MSIFEMDEILLWSIPEGFFYSGSSDLFIDHFVKSLPDSEKI